jgi:hypothetical protein
LYNRQRGASIILVLIIIISVGALGYFFNAKTLVSSMVYGKRRYETSVTAQGVVRAIHDYLIYAVQQRWCLNAQFFDRDVSCSYNLGLDQPTDTVGRSHRQKCFDMDTRLQHPYNLERFLWGEVALNDIQKKYDIVCTDYANKVKAAPPPPTYGGLNTKNYHFPASPEILAVGVSPLNKETFGLMSVHMDLDVKTITDKDAILANYTKLFDTYTKLAALFPSPWNETFKKWAQIYKDLIDKLNADSGTPIFDQLYNSEILKRCIKRLSVDIARSSTVPSKGESVYLDFKIMIAEVIDFPGDAMMTQQCSPYVKYTMESTVMFSPRPLNQFSLIKAGDFNLTDYKVSAPPGDYEDRGLIFAGPVMVAKNLVLPETESNFAPVNFQGRIHLGAGRLKTSSGGTSKDYFPATYGDFSDQLHYYPGIIGINNGLYYEPEFDLGLDYLFEPTRCTPGPESVVNCSPRKKVIDDSKQDMARLWLAKESPGYGPVQTYQLGLSGKDEFANNINKGLNPPVSSVGAKDNNKELVAIISYADGAAKVDPGPFFPLNTTTWNGTLVLPNKGSDLWIDLQILPAVSTLDVDGSTATGFLWSNQEKTREKPYDDLDPKTPLQWNTTPEHDTGFKHTTFTISFGKSRFDKLWNMVRITTKPVAEDWREYNGGIIQSYMSGTYNPGLPDTSAECNDISNFSYTATPTGTKTVNLRPAACDYPNPPVNSRLSVDCDQTCKKSNFPADTLDPDAENTKCLAVCAAIKTAVDDFVNNKLKPYNQVLLNGWSNIRAAPVKYPKLNIETKFIRANKREFKFSWENLESFKDPLFTYIDNSDLKIVLYPQDIPRHMPPGDAPTPPFVQRNDLYLKINRALLPGGGLVFSNTLPSIQDIETEMKGMRVVNYNDFSDDFGWVPLAESPILDTNAYTDKDGNSHYLVPSPMRENESLSTLTEIDSVTYQFPVYDPLRPSPDFDKYKNYFKTPPQDPLQLMAYCADYSALDIIPDWDVSLVGNSMYSWMIDPGGNLVADMAEICPNIADDYTFQSTDQNPDNYLTIPHGSLLKDCTVPSTFNVLLGFYSCNKLIIEDRATSTAPLSLIGTYIVNDLVIKNPTETLRKGITFYPLWNKSAVELLKKNPVAKPHLPGKMSGPDCNTFIANESANIPIWSLSDHPDFGKRAYFSNCSPAKFVTTNAINNFNWTTVDPEVGIDPRSRAAQNVERIKGRYRRYNTSIIKQRLGVGL